MLDGRASRLRTYPWSKAAVLFAVAVGCYALLPVIAPLNAAGAGGLSLVGIGLGLVVGLALRCDEQFTVPLAAGAGAAVLVGALLEGMPTGLCIALGAGVGLEVWAVAYLLRATGAAGLRNPGQVGRLIVVAVLTGVVAACIAAVLVHLFGMTIGDPWYEIRAWATDDIFGLIVIAPALALAPDPRTWPWDRAVEFAVAAVFTGVVTIVIFFFTDAANPGLLGWPYLVVIGPAWIAVRLGAAAVAPVSAVVFWLAAVATADDFGPYTLASADAVDRVVTVEVYAIVLASGLLALGTLRDDRLRQLDRARESSRLLDEVINGSEASVYAKDYDDGGRYVMVNEGWHRVSGTRDEDVLGRTDTDLFPPEVALAYGANDARVIAEDAPLVFEERYQDDAGTVRIVSSSKFPLRDNRGRVWGVGGVSTDISDTVRAREVEVRQAELLHAVFELSPTPAVRLQLRGDGTLTPLDANAAMLALVGLPAGAPERLDLMARVHPDDLALAWESVRASARSGGPDVVAPVRQREIRLQAADGHAVHVLMSAASVRNPDPPEDLPDDSGSEAVEVVAQFEDVTARRTAEQALADQARRDAVTGLPNRRALHDRMGAALHRLRLSPGTVTVLVCDIDRFKDVNDSLGHQAGDELLRELAVRLRATLRPEDTLARLGGDEFVVLIEGLKDVSEAVMTGLRLQDRIGEAWPFGGQAFQPHMSIGVATATDADITVDELLRRADLAMYEAKDAGRNRVQVYERSVDDEIQRAVAIQHDLRRAIDASGLVVHYQPVVRLADATILGGEALVRLRNTDGTLMPPGSFVPQAEATGLVVPMGAWVLRRALADLRKWRERGLPYVVSVNVSQWQHREQGFAAFVLDLAEQAGVSPTWLVVEVTETALINDPVLSGRELAELSEAGVGVALDDFGTGYSSLSWLTELPVNAVKIDQAFTSELGTDARKGAIVKALIEVSHDLGLTVVAEGVETEQQRDLLLALGCDQGQGYLFGPPAAVDEPPWA
ncbi:MAG: EAL domain-containing protein [Actinomycetota bacterium]|nr:EAL domain-containing protein [Actinomycetota bacterium]